MGEMEPSDKIGEENGDYDMEKESDEEEKADNSEETEPSDKIGEDKADDDMEKDESEVEEISEEMEQSNKTGEDKADADMEKDESDEEKQTYPKGWRNLMRVVNMGKRVIRVWKTSPKKRKRHRKRRYPRKWNLQVKIKKI